MNNEFVTRRGLISLGGITFPYVSISGTYTFTIDDYFVDCVSGSFNVTLPLSSTLGAGKILVIKNSGTGSISVVTTSPDLIEGATSYALNQFDTLNLINFLPVTTLSIM